MSLKPCPFCGENSVGVQLITMGTKCEITPQIVCSDCGAMMDDDEDDWNRRTPGPATKAMIAECKLLIRGTPMTTESIQRMRVFIAEWEDL